MGDDALGETLATRNIYRGRIFTVDVDRVKLPHGPEIDLEVVRHPGSVVIIPVTATGDIILVRQYRHVVGRYLWELPAGSLAHGEDPMEGARRECHEEIGLVPRVLEQVAALYPTPGFCSERMFFYRCTDLQKPATEAHQDEDEDLEPRTFTLADIRAMLRSGDIADMKTAVGLGLMDGCW
jgi:ADP-ribose diphosphatase